MPTITERLTEKLRAAFDPVDLEVIDESEHHVGHAGHDGLGESHFHVKVVSRAFDGMPRLQRHRLINETVAEELAERVHALSIKALAPSDRG